MNPLIKHHYRSGEASPTLSVNEKSKDLIKRGQKVYQFGFGQSPFPVPKTVVKALQENAHQKSYLPVNGLPALRQAINDDNHRKGIPSSPENILIGPGSKILIYLLQLVLEGELLLPAPSWVSYAPQALMVDKPLQWLSTRAEDNWMLHPEILEAYCKNQPTTKKLLILNYPSNPTGATYTTAQLKALAEVARKYELILLSDEIYGELCFEQAHTSLAHFYPEGTIVSSGLSKWCGAGGWRLGTFTFPPNLKPVMKAISMAGSETYSAVSAPVQFAAIKAYQQNDEVETYLKKCRWILKSIANRISTKLFAANIRHPKPQGGFYLLPDFEYYREKLASKGIFNSNELCQKLLIETGVALLPGAAFGMPEEGLQARLAFVDFDGEAALKFFDEKLRENHLESITNLMFEGIDKMINWLNR